MSASESCARCPCPDICLRWPVWCDEWSGGDEVQRRHICARSAMGAHPDYPPLATQATSLGRAFWDWAVSGFTMATEDEQARRLMVCAGCSYFEPAARRCRLCGCFLMAKVQLRTGHCPLPEPKW